MEVLLYSAKGSNSSERVEWVLNFKGIHFDRIEVSSSELATTYLDLNPFGYVPSLSVDGSVFSESMAIIEYLEERFPKPTLFGKNLDEKTHIRRVCEYVNTSIHSPQNRTVLKFMRPELDEMSKRELRGDWIMRCLEKLSTSICRESGLAVGNSFSVADIFVASIYKKALQHGCVKSDFYDKHLMYVRANESALVSEPQA
ncbi:glutathione S-transferase family protein [Vibrio lentus]|uniref:Glutathione S-transferase n=1 Tax=Vibrio lentus TaxID=136468 RepID=A0AA44VRS8_9VIBR|nr:glutathione S-transferase N-terminal domain-containing protein [Vibrio lentus]MCB5358560.1 glutathione S-transferase family protein [Vibrio lentus]MCB5449028.1 glutathione S-transferase family protein [Vibrio lentus]MCB5460915.1 glutathione S-transferase family protein [Vibrio lentus]MCC4795291.1 glutathione S-transferase N-terminal domain-containing protein [Vibrio lentus]MCC4852272.1 glutathione S-transferase N-terminal domain-containing protein [Vibrio lentus]